MSTVSALVSLSRGHNCRMSRLWCLFFADTRAESRFGCFSRGHHCRMYRLWCLFGGQNCRMYRLWCLFWGAELSNVSALVSLLGAELSNVSALVSFRCITVACLEPPAKVSHARARIFSIVCLGRAGRERGAGAARQRSGVAGPRTDGGRRGGGRRERIVVRESLHTTPKFGSVSNSNGKSLEPVGNIHLLETFQKNYTSETQMTRYTRTFFELI